MYILKRSWYYITRKRGKSITIGIILFIVATLVLTGLVINNAANKTFKVAKNKLGSDIIYKSDTSSIVNDAMQSRGEGEKINPGEITLPDDYTSLTTKEVDEIVNNSKYVKNYKYNVYFTGNPVGFEAYSLSSSEGENNSSNNVSNDKNMIASLTITGANEEGDVLNSSNTLSSGAFFTEEQLKSGENVIIIEKTLADLNELSVGDTIVIDKVEMKRGRKNFDESSDSESQTVEVTYKVVGIYETENKTDLASTIFGMSMNMEENKMYVPAMSILKMQEIGLSDSDLNELIENGYVIESVTFVIDDPENQDLFIEEVENMENINLKYRSLSIDNEAYNKMVGNIESISSTAKILVIVVIISGIAIIMLLSMLTIKDRKYEIGVLLSLGESKIKVLFQLVSEILIVGIIAFTLAVGATSLFAQKITNYLLNNEVSSSTTIDMDKMTNVSDSSNNLQENRGFNKGFGNFNMSKPDTSSLDVEVIDELTVNITPPSVLALYGVGILIIVIGNILQALFVLKLNPKEIMLDR